MARWFLNIVSDGRRCCAGLLAWVAGGWRQLRTRPWWQQGLCLLFVVAIPFHIMVNACNLAGVVFEEVAVDRPWAGTVFAPILGQKMALTPFVDKPGQRLPLDYEVYREFGRRFLTGEPLYSDRLCYNYLPVRAMLAAPLAIVEPRLGMAIHFLASVACLLLTFHWLVAMSCGRCTGKAWDSVEIGLVALFLGVRYLLDDLSAVAGLHLILMAILVGGVYCAWKGRDKLSAVWFGLAIVMKLMPAIFVFFMLWKRQWRLAAFTCVATLLWIVSPVLWMGPAHWWQQQDVFNRMIVEGVGGQSDGIRQGNEMRLSNQCLKLAIVRHLTTYPPEHHLHLSAPLAVPSLNLDAKTADRIAGIGMLLLVAVCAWWSRRPYQSPRDPAWVVETSGVMILMTLLSPVTWTHHLVLLLPALWLLVAHDRMFKKLQPRAQAVLWIYIVSTIVITPFLGKTGREFLQSWHLQTIAMFLILGLLVAVRPLCSASSRATSATTPQRRAA